MRKSTTFAIALLLAALLALPGILFAQSQSATAKPAGVTVTITDWENNSGNSALLDDKGAAQPEPSIGDKFPLGWTITTGKGDTAELQLDPTKTVIKIAQLTNFTVNSLRTDSGGTDTFNLTLGKVRTVVGRASGKDQFKIRTPSAVGGVRGSDIVIDTGDGTQDKLFTLEGTGYMQKNDGTELDVPVGTFVDALAAVFQAVQIPADLLSSLQSEMKFSPNTDVSAANAAHQEELQAPAGGASTEQPAPAGGTTTPPAPKTSSFLDDIMKKLQDILGMEIGSITIGGQTYSKAVISPTFSLGKLKMSLYLPIIYTGDMFNPADYYHPAGNDEWNFGGLLTGVPVSSDPLVVAGDVFTDLLLKIKYIEWGAQRDPFFFKLGNLNDITIGHGLIMRNFANDADFPAVRRVGLNIGADLGGFGFEAMVNDAAAPDIFGGRLYIRPIKGFKAALGLSTLMDIGAGKDFNGGPAAAGDPIFINPGLDLDLPFFESDVFSIVAFADGAAMLPYFRTAPTAATGIAQGFAWNAIVDPSDTTMPVKNWGVATGLFGNLIIPGFTWRAEFRDYTGAFTPEFYSSGYERQRSQFVQNVLDYLQNPAAAQFNQQTLGIYGEGGLVLPKLFSLNLNYFWPWTQDPVTKELIRGQDDHFGATFTLEKGVIPVVNIYGSVSYERTKFITTFLNGGEQRLTLAQALFDANTVVSASISYPVSDVLDVTLLYTTTARRDPVTGVLVYKTPTDLLPEMDTSLSIETQIHL